MSRLMFVPQRWRVSNCDRVSTNQEPVLTYSQCERKQAGANVCSSRRKDANVSPFSPPPPPPPRWRRSSRRRRPQWRTTSDNHFFCWTCRSTPSRTPVSTTRPSAASSCSGRSSFRFSYPHRLNSLFLPSSQQIHTHGRLRPPVCVHVHSGVFFWQRYLCAGVTFFSVYWGENRGYFNLRGLICCVFFRLVVAMMK